MDRITLLIAALTGVVVGMTLYHRRAVKRKNRSIVRQIEEHDRLEKLLENTFRTNIKLRNRLESAQYEKESND